MIGLKEQMYGKCTQTPWVVDMLTGSGSMHTCYHDIHWGTKLEF